MSDSPAADQKAADRKTQKTPHGKYRIATYGDSYLHLGAAHNDVVVGPDGVQVDDAQYQAALDQAAASGVPIIDLTQES